MRGYEESGPGWSGLAGWLAGWCSGVLGAHRWDAQVGRPGGQHRWPAGCQTLEWVSSATSATTMPAQLHGCTAARLHKLASLTPTAATATCREEVRNCKNRRNGQERAGAAAEWKARATVATANKWTEEGRKNEGIKNNASTGQASGRRRKHRVTDVGHRLQP